MVPTLCLSMSRWQRIDHGEIIEVALQAHPKAKAVMVALCGQSAAMDRIMALCRPRGIKVVEDAAHAFRHGVATDDRHLRRCDLFQLLQNKTITTGGMVCS